MTYNDIFSAVSSHTGLSQDFVRKVYKAYWKVVREHIISLPLKDDLSDEAFLSLQPNVNIPSIGKFYVTPERYRRVKNYHNLIQKEKENYATHQEN
jgi:hypothetical protein